MTSSAEQSFPEEKFLADFLYADRPRLAVLAAQLFDDGQLTALKKSSQTGSEITGKIAGGVPGIAKGESGAIDKTLESVERHFDATWAAPILVLRELNERGLIAQDLKLAALGQIVLVRGSVQVTDLRMLKTLWRPVVKAEEAKNLASAKTDAERKKAQRAAKEALGIVDLVELLPHALQFHVRNESVACWATLDPDEMTISPADLAFKHGAAIAGEWIVLGVLDAKPSSIFDAVIQSIKHADTPLKLGMVQVLNGLREGFGRGANDYGITPLAIYRTIE